MPSAKRLDVTIANMATYLFAWNPKLWDWPALTRDCAKLSRRGYLDIRWSSGRSRRIEPGSDAYLVRLGVPPKGLFGRGVTMTSPVQGPHWRPDKEAQGARTMYVRLRLTALFESPVVTFDELAEPPFLGYRWGIRQSGAYVPLETAAALHALWERNARSLDLATTPDASPSGSRSTKRRRSQRR